MSKHEQWPDSYLKTFDAFVGDPRSERYANALLKKYLDESPSKDHQAFSIADICCGTGHMGRSIETYLKSIGKEIQTTFIDKSETILKGIALSSTDKTICTNITSMKEIPSASFDIAVCRYGFNNLPKDAWTKALEEVLRVLKPGGIFILQDHFVPGPVFSALVNEAEQFLAKMEGKEAAPFIYSTEDFNEILDKHPSVQSRIKAGYGLFINIWDRLRSKKEILPDFQAAKKEILRFYEETCLKKYKVLIVDEDEYIHVYNITYAIVKTEH